MSFSSAAFAAASTDNDHRSFMAISLKPILQFITTECLASMPSSGLNVVDFVIQLLVSNKERLDHMCRGTPTDAVATRLQSCHIGIDNTASDTNASASPSPVQFAHAVAAAMQRRDEACMRKVFDRHADSSGKLSVASLSAALKDIDAPVLAAATSDGSSDPAHRIFCRADANMSGDVDFAE